MKINTNCYLVSFSPFEDDGSICLVGQKNSKQGIDIVNAFDDQKKVEHIYKILTDTEYVWPDDLK